VDVLMVALFAVLVLLLLTAALTVSAVGTPSPVSFLLGAYVVAWAEVVGLALVLSPFDAFGRTGLLLGSGVVLAVAAAVWVATGRRRPPSFRPALQQLRAELADPVLGILAATVTLALAYAVVLGVATPQNDWDSLTYHLTRAALWIQQGSVSYVPDVADVRINGNPPNAEIGQAWTMLLGKNDRFVWLPSLAAVPALVLGVSGVARRAGLQAREALFGAFLFGCLPLVVLQSATAMNDLVVASFFVVATYFAIGESRKGGLGAALSLGLAFGTKISAPLLLPIYLLVVLVARRRRFAEQCAIVIFGMALGGVWYGLNLAQTGSLDGGMTEATGQSADRHPALVLTRAYQLLLNTIELPGSSPTRSTWLFALFAIMLVIAGGVARIRGRPGALLPLAAAGVIVFAVPSLLVVEGNGITRVWRLSWAALGRNEPADELSQFNLPTVSDPSLTWYGPVGALLIFGGIVLALRASGSRRHLHLALALAPLVFVIILATNVPWDPWRGRFFVFPIALAAAAWSLAYRFRALAWAAVGLTVVSATLVLVNQYPRPPGIPLLARATTPSVFGEPRWRVQTRTRNEDGTDEVVEYVEKHVPPDASVGLALGQDDFSYPYFGAHLGRTVRFLTPGAPASADESWIVEAPAHKAPRCARSWTTAVETQSGFRVLRRTAADTC
jgi:hypothetical protein